MADKEERFNAFLKEHNNQVNGDFTICGYDPMNMIKINNMILCYHFIMLHNEQDKESLFIKGPLMLFLKEDTNNQVYSYIT